MNTTSEENEQLQQEERMAVCAIYGDDILQLDQGNSSADQAVYSLTLNIDQDDPNIVSPRVFVLRLFFPSTYPSVDMPVFEVATRYCGSHKVDSDMVDTIEQGLRALFEPGQVILFEWIQWLRDYIQDNITPSYVPLPTPQEDNTNNKNDNKNENPSSLPTDPVPSIFSSEPLVDRKSTFVAHVAHVKTAHQVQQVVHTLLQNNKIARATHNIMAYRIQLEGDQILQDNDDDGETAAGGRLMHLLQILDVKDVVVVVSRWFGGILLGADRFKDINNCARKALEDCGYVKMDQNKKKGKK
ncbi:ribosomal protein S5 domain 2-type protein [Halteromyces radiatus]|uniref:ribosomal protein S5 domain 2-type protein n=1 Tax=Halteromyces radiatus TaxID=101107 RepID=UPI0022205E72|nr:ribosomal protein S5 domain 2-type protein [Halteromyces radiatus]KAI8089229.1 ribosomal protein S5 domain 2-type protein [Halteromyces radiatus]